MPIDLLNIVYSFLENRKGFIYHEKFKSSLFDILAGAPRGPACHLFYFAYLSVTFLSQKIMLSFLNLRMTLWLG